MENSVKTFKDFIDVDTSLNEDIQEFGVKESKTNIESLQPKDINEVIYIVENYISSKYFKDSEIAKKESIDIIKAIQEIVK